MPEYQCLWFQFYRAFNFCCIAIATEPLLPSSPQLATDWVAFSIAAALETSVTAFAVIAAAAVAVAVANNDDHPHNGHDINNYLHDDGHDDVIVDKGLTLSCSPLVVRPVEHGDQLLCPSLGLMAKMTNNRTNDADKEEHGVAEAFLLNLEAAQQGRSVLLLDEHKLLLKERKKGYAYNKMDFMSIKTDSCKA
jgi:hypothetical protein